MLRCTSTMEVVEEEFFCFRSVLDSAQYITNNASRVNIDSDAVEHAAEQLLPHLLRSPPSDPDSSPVDPLEPTRLSDSEVLEWIFLLDTLNFCFWSDKTTLFTVNYRGESWTGYRSLCAALCRAKELYHLPVHKPAFYGSVTMETMKRIFHSDSDMELPLLAERMSNLHEAGRVLNQRFHGSVAEMVGSCEHSAQKLVQLLVNNFKSYRDTCSYKGQPVSFLKRAQIFAADVWDRFDGRGYGEFNDIHTLTMFADYRVPQSLLYLGVLCYDNELMTRLKEGVHLVGGAEEEVEIRGCSIWAVELIKRAMQSLLSRSADGYHDNDQLTAVKIDYYLWNYAKTHSSPMKTFPIHRTYSIYY